MPDDEAASARPRFPFAWDGRGPEPTESPWGECGRSLTLGVVSCWAKVILGVANTLNIAVRRGPSLASPGLLRC